MQSLLSLLSVAAGGAIGASARYGLSVWLGPAVRFPLSTLVANVLGCFLAGILYVVLSQRSESSELQLLLITGVLGGFTTFSAFSIDSMKLLESGQWSMFAGNVVLNVLGSLTAVLLGALLVRRLLF